MFQDVIENFKQHLAVLLFVLSSQDNVVDEGESFLDSTDHLGHDFLKDSRRCLDSRLQPVNIEETQMSVDRK